jgi:hypothetical protein
MNFKKLLLASVAGFAVMFALAGLWHNLIMEQFYKSYKLAALGGHEPVPILLGYLILALLMAYIYPKGYSGGSPAKEGLKFGIIIGLLWILPHSLVLFGESLSTSTEKLIINTIWHLVEQGGGGIAIGLVYSKLK